MYKVIKDFSDREDNRFVYRAGDIYPRLGYTPSNDRVAGLLGTDNGQGVPLIEEYVSLAKEDAQEAKTDVDPPKKSEAKRRPRKRQEEHA